MMLDPNLPSKRDLWVNVYKSVVDGLYRNGNFLRAANEEAKMIADQSITDYEEQFEKD